MKSFKKIGSALALGCLAVGSAARAVGYTSPQDWIKPYKREALQDIVSLEKQGRQCESDVGSNSFVLAGNLGQGLTFRSWRAHLFVLG